MILEELEFIRDFSNDIDMLDMDLGDFCLELESDTDENDQKQRMMQLTFWHFKHRVELISKILYSFKNTVDEKYHTEWQKSMDKQDDWQKSMQEKSKEEHKNEEIQ